RLVSALGAAPGSRRSSGATGYKPARGAGLAAGMAADRGLEPRSSRLEGGRAILSLTSATEERRLALGGQLRVWPPGAPATGGGRNDPRSPGLPRRVLSARRRSSLANVVPAGGVEPPSLR